MSSFNDMSSGTSTPMAWIPLTLCSDITDFLSEFGW